MLFLETTVKNLSVTAFVLSVFAFSWLCWGIGIATGQPTTIFPTVIFYILGGSGPTLVALFYLLRFFDREARRDFWSRLFDFRRISLAGWLLCLLAGPVVVVSSLALDLLLGGELPTMPNLEMLIAQPASIPVFVLIMLIGGALSEELGWRGVVLESFQQRWTPLRATLVLGFTWWIFHFPLFFLRGTVHYDWGLFTPQFWVFLFNVIPLTACLTLAYNHYRRSILSAVLIHFSYNLVLSILVPISLRAYGFVALGLCLIVWLALNRYGWGGVSWNPAENSVPYDLPAGHKL
jgi:membrane protease YdiL (CAAX protease family)